MMPSTTVVLPHASTTLHVRIQIQLCSHLLHITNADTSMLYSRPAAERPTAYGINSKPSTVGYSLP